VEGDRQPGPQVTLFSNCFLLLAAELAQVVAATPVTPLGRVVGVDLKDEVGATTIVPLQLHRDECWEGRAPFRELHFVVHSPIRAAQELVGALDRARNDTAMNGHDVGEEGEVKGSRDPHDPDLDVFVSRGPPMDQAAISCPPGHALQEAAQGSSIGNFIVRLKFNHEVSGDCGHIS